METLEEGPQPVLVDRKKRSTRPKDTPNPPNNQPPSVENHPDPPVEPQPTGEPDHSLVPSPPKKLLEPKEFFEYWNSIPKRERDAWFIAYPYRKLPVCDVLQPLSIEEIKQIERKQRKKPDTNCGKLTQPFDPENWEQAVYEWKGAGDYQIRLNDQHPSVRGTVCETHIRGLRDWDRFPPILNPEEVVLEEPLNQPYLRFARLRGIKFPGDPNSEPTINEVQNEEDMANVAAVEKLTDALIESSRRPVVVPPPATPAPPDRSNDILADAALKGQQILLDSIKAQGKAQDPMEFHKAVTEAAKAMAPAPTASSGNSDQMLSMMQLMMKQQADSNALMLAQLEKRLESAERRAEAAEARAHAAVAAPAVNPANPNPHVSNPVKDAIELIKGLGTLRDTATGILGAAVEDADMPVWARVASKAMDVVPGMLHNAAVMYSGKGEPAPPPELAPEVVAAETANADAVPAVAPAEEGTGMTKQRIAMEIATPLINALNEQKHGFEFAAGMILAPKILGFPGRVVYEMAVAEGENGMYNLLQSYPPLWEKLTRIPKRFETFLKEFLDRETALAIAAGTQPPPPQQAQPTPTPPPTAAPANGAPMTPEVLPAEKPEKPRGRTVIAPDGKPVQTVHKGPAVNTTPSS